MLHVWLDLITPIQCFPVTLSLIQKLQEKTSPKWSLKNGCKHHSGQCCGHNTFFVCPGVLLSKAIPQQWKIQIVKVYNVDAADHYAIRPSGKKRPPCKPSCFHYELGYKTVGYWSNNLQVWGVTKTENSMTRGGGMILWLLRDRKKIPPKKI